MHHPIMHAMSVPRHCPTCNGQGKSTYGATCHDCDGTGVFGAMRWRTVLMLLVTASVFAFLFTLLIR